MLSLAPLGWCRQGLTLEQTVGRGEPVDLDGDLDAWAWADDGVHLVRGRGDDARWVDPTTGDELEPLDSPPTGSDEALPAKPHEPARELEERSPDGRWLAWALDSRLFVIPAAGGEPRALTPDEGEKIRSGKLDWVYQEEVYGRGNYKAFWWSPDSSRIAFLRLDGTRVPEYPLVEHVHEDYSVRTQVTAYPMAGEPNPQVSLGLVEVAGGAPTWVDLERYSGSDPLVVRVDWAPDGTLTFVVQDRLQTWADLVRFDPERGTSRVLVHEHSRAWVDRPPAPRWLADGSFLWESSFTGWKHLYRFTGAGERVAALTRGEWSVTSVEEVDEERGVVWFTGRRDGALERNLYRVGLDGEGLARATRDAGWHDVTFNRDRSMFLDRHSSLGSPPEVRLCNATGEVLRVLERAELPEDVRLSRWERFEIPARDGFPLDVALLRPADFDESECYPVWLPTYSGPDALTVRDRWNASTWYQFLSQQGFVVLQVNVRTASGKGRGITSQGYLRLGVLELSDLEDAVRWLVAHPWADAERVGISGHSYGGFMTAYALTHSDAFALGIAGAGVYDWAMYDSIYTERYMSTPELNPAGYAEASVVRAAADLQGHLLLHAGTLDDNVHAQNTLHLAWALQKAGKPFDLMLYPKTRHGVRDPDLRWHLRQLEWRTMRAVLGQPAIRQRPVAERGLAPRTEGD